MVEIVLPVVSAVAVPETVPIKVVEVNEVNPVTEVTVPPNVIVVEPKVVELFANLLLAIAVPLHTPDVIVPTVAKFDKEVNVVLEVAVIFPAVVAVVELPKKLGAAISLLNVFAPAKVWAPVVTIPPLLASAGVKINSVVPLIVAPFAFEVAETFPIELKPALAAVIEAFTYSVVAIFVELSLVAGVGVVGVPVKAGDAMGAFNKILAVF